MTMVRGTLASYGEVTSWSTLGPPSPRPNPQKLLVPARDPLVVAPRPGSRPIPMTSGTAARDQDPGTGAAPHSAGTRVFVSSDGPVAEVMAHCRNVIRAARDSGVARNVALSGLDAGPSSPFCHVVSYGYTGQPLARAGARPRSPGHRSAATSSSDSWPAPAPAASSGCPPPMAGYRWSPALASRDAWRRSWWRPRAAATTTSPVPSPPTWLPLQPRRRASGAPRGSTPASRPSSTGQRWLSPLRTPGGNTRTRRCSRRSGDNAGRQPPMKSTA